jgi:hypothetical protein
MSKEQTFDISIDELQTTLEMKHIRKLNDLTLDIYVNGVQTWWEEEIIMVIDNDGISLSNNNSTSFLIRNIKEININVEDNAVYGISIFTNKGIAYLISQGKNDVLFYLSSYDEILDI